MHRRNWLVRNESPRPDKGHIQIGKQGTDVVAAIGEGQTPAIKRVSAEGDIS